MEFTKRELLDTHIKDNALTSAGVRRPHLVFVMIMVVLILGVFAFTTLRVELFPNMNIPIVAVMIAQTEEPNPTLAEETWQLTERLEAQLNGIGGVDTVTTITIDMMGRGMIVALVELHSGTSVDGAAFDVQLGLGRINHHMERHGFFQSDIMRFDITMMPVLVFSSSYRGPIPERPGSISDEDWESQQAMITWTWYQNLIRDISSVPGVGSVNHPFERRPDDPSPQGLEQFNFNYFNNRESFTMSINQRADAVTTETVAGVLAALQSVRSDNPGFVYNIMFDQAEFINDSIGTVTANLLIGGLLTIIILFFFLRSVKITLAIAIAIPISIIGTFVLMYFMGMTLNIVTLAGLALAVGMLVDNSVIVVENIYRLREKGMPIREAATKGASQIFGAVLAATFTTMAVFIPMFFVEGLIMEVFIDMVWVIVFSLLASLIVAIMFLPSIIAAFKIEPRKKVEKRDNWLTRTGERIDRGYNSALKFFIKHKWYVLPLVIMLFVGSFFLANTNGFELMPAEDTGSFSTTISVNPGFGVGQATVLTTARIMDENPTWFIAGVPNPAHIADIDAASSIVFPMMLFTVQRDAAYELATEELYYVLNDELGSSVQSIGVSFTAMPLMGALMGGDMSPSLSFDVTLRNNRSISTTRASQMAYNAIREHLTASGGLGIVDHNNPVVTSYRFANNMSASSGVDTMAADSIVITLVATGLERDVVQTRLDVAIGMVRETVAGVSGVHSALDNFNVAIERRVDGNITASVTATVNEGQNISQVQSRVDTAVGRLMNNNSAVFEGMRLEEDGFAAQMGETVVQMMLALLIGLALMYLVMVAIFRSFKSPFIMLITIPLAFTGGFLLLWMFGMSLSIVAMIGLLILMGVVVNNGIVLVDYINQAREEGLSVNEAVVAAANVRARPILMTAISTIFAMIPMAIGWGTSVAMMQPMAVITIGGLIYATVLSLLVVPAFYAIFNREKREPEQQVMELTTIDEQMSPQPIGQ